MFPLTINPITVVDLFYRVSRVCIKRYHFVIFQSATMLCAKTLILSTTPNLISEMNFVEGNDKTTTEIQKTQSLLRDQVYRMKTQQIWLFYEKPWWNKSSNETFMHIISNSPIGELLCKTILPLNASDNDDNKTELSVVSLKLNSKYRSYWEGLTRGETSQLENKTQSTVSTVFMEHLLLHLCKLTTGTSNCSAIPEPIGYLLHKWNGLLFGQTSFTWKSGINMQETVKHLKKPFPNHNTYLVGSWFENVSNQMDSVTGDLHAVQDFANYFQN